MAGGGSRPSAGCCCFHNNVRFLILATTTFAVSALYANLILFNLTSILHTDLPKDYFPVAGLDSLHEYSTWHDRKRREINEAEKPKKEENDGYPILPPTLPPKTTTMKSISTTKNTEKPRTVFITNFAIETTTAKVLTTTKSERSIPNSSKNEEDVVANEVAKTLKKLKDAEDREKLNKTDVLDGKTLKQSQQIEDDYETAPKEPVSTRLKRALLYSAPGIGVLSGICISISLAKTIGVQKLFSAFLALAAILTFSTPFAVASSYIALLALRFLQGFLFSVVFPVIGHVLVQWGPLKEQLLFITVMIMFIAVAPTVSWPASMLIFSNEAPLYAIYTIHAVELVFFALVWLIFYRNKPQNHPWVTGQELNKIVAGKVQELQSNRALTQPYSTLLRSLSAWSIWFSAFGLFLAVSFFATYLPSFLSSKDVFFVDYLGAYSVLPVLFLPIVCLLAAIVINFTEASTKNVRIINTIGFVFTAFFILGLPLMFHLGSQNIPLLVLSLTLLPFGLSVVGGFGRSLTVVGRVFAQQIVSICGFSFGIAFIIMPIIVSFSVHENKLSDWNNVIAILVFVLLVVAVEFAVFGRGRSASWAESSWDPLVASTKMQSLALIDFNQDECGLYELRRIEPKK